MIVWLVRALVLVLTIAAGAGSIRPAQDQSQNAAAEQFFSGVVSGMQEGRVTVSRTALGKEESRTFVITAETRIEGKLRDKARVTVRYRTTEEGDIAVHIIVRGQQAGARVTYWLTSRAGASPTLPC